MSESIGVCTVDGKNVQDVASKIVEVMDNVKFAIFFTSETINSEKVDEIKESLSCPFIGCYTEGIIYKGKIKRSACALAFEGINAETEISISPETIGNKLRKIKEGTVIILINWKTRKVSSILRDIYNQLGYNFSYTGGCSGSLSSEYAIQFSDKGISENGICAASINTRMSVAMDHGWEVISGPYIITKYSEDRIYELDGKKAFDVYSKVTRCQKDDFDECKKEYPFGFLCACGKYMLRAPMEYYNDGSIRLMSEVPYSSVTLIMGCKDEEDIINAAENAARSATMQCGKSKFAIIFDCVSRKELLGKRFNEELKRLDEVLDIPYIGMLSVGEILSTQKVCTPSFHNKSVVVAVGGD